MKPELSPAAKAFIGLCFIIILSATMILGGLLLVDQDAKKAKQNSELAKTNSEANQELLQGLRELSESKRDILEVILAVTGCVDGEPPEACRQRQLEGRTGLAVEIDCRNRRALAGLPMPPADKPCTL